MDVERLLSDLDADAPCGPNLEYDDQFGTMSRAAIGKPEQRMGDSVVDAVDPDWRTVRSEALALFDRTKDLQVLLYLTQACLRLDGFKGLAPCLALLAGLIERHWNHVHPQLDPDDDNDPTFRVNVISSFCGPETLLLPMRTIPLVVSRAAGRFNLNDILIAQGKMSAPEGAEDLPDSSIVEAAFMDCDIEELKSTALAVRQSFESLEAVDKSLTAALGAGLAADLTPLKKLLREIDVILQEQMARRGLGAEETGGETVAGFDAAGAGSASAPAGPAALPGRLNSREEVIRVLDLANEYFTRVEPSSPVPLLLNRAKRLVSKDFLDIIRDMAPDGMNQAELIRGPETE
jgi:type VI secretion system protein ImpA